LLIFSTAKRLNENNQKRLRVPGALKTSPVSMNKYFYWWF